MTESENALYIPRTKFYINDTRLDSIALKIIWERDKKLWESNIVKRYPVFSSIQSWDSKDIKEILEHIYAERQDELLHAQEKFTLWWSKVEENWQVFLTDIFGLKNRNEIYYNAHIGIAPIFPRDIRRESFLVPLYADRHDILKIGAHETSHFAFYRKLEEIDFIEQPNEKHIWIVSEVLVPLLFSDRQAIAILGEMPRNSYICQQSLIEKYREIYSKRAEKIISVEQFIEDLFKIEIKDKELNQKYLKR